MYIAVIVDTNGKVTGFDNAGIVKLYQKNKSSWAEEREFVYAPESFSNPSVIRKTLKEICEWLGECKIFVAEKIIGFCYTVFESYQISMWEMTGNPEDFLNYIHEAEQMEQEKPNEPPKVIEPVEQFPGKFYLDLKEAMSGTNAPSSKQILLHFLNEKSFDVIDVICDHIPRWFEKELPLMGMEMETVKYRDCLKAIIKPSKKG